jgi:hypothetical protein
MGVIGVSGVVGVGGGWLQSREPPVPVPVRAIVWVPPTPSLASARDPEHAPLPLGLKVTVIVQLARNASGGWAAQPSLAIAKPPVPVMTDEPIVSR